MRWLTAYPACRVASPSIADDRPLVLCATWGVCVHRAQSVDEILGVVGFVRAKRDRPRPIGARLDHGRRPQSARRGCRPKSDRPKSEQLAIWSSRALKKSSCPLSRRSVGRIESPSAIRWSDRITTKRPDQFARNQADRRRSAANAMTCQSVETPKVRPARILHGRLLGFIGGDPGYVESSCATPAPSRLASLYPATKTEVASSRSMA